MPDSVDVRHVRQRIRQDIVDALQACRSLAQQQDRHLLSEILSDRVDRRLPLRDGSPPRLQFVELVRTCANMEAGILALADAMEELEPGSPETRAVQRYADEWEALAAVPDLAEAWSWLADALRVLTRPVDLPDLVREATGARVRVLPRHCTTAWEVFTHLVAQNTAPNCLPPWMFFLNRVAEWLEPVVAKEVQARNLRWAGRWELLGALYEADRTRESRRVTPPRRGFLMIQIAPDPIESDRYTLSFWYQWEQDGPVPMRGADQAVYRHELEQSVETVVASVEEAWGDRGGELRLEFVLPFALLNEPVEWWPRDSKHEPAVTLAVSYPVVVRSLDRLRTRRWHRAWRLRWEQLVREPTTSRVRWNKLRCKDHVRRVEAELNLDSHCVAVVLSEPPTPEQGAGYRDHRSRVGDGRRLGTGYGQGGATRATGAA